MPMEHIVLGSLKYLKDNADKDYIARQTDGECTPKKERGCPISVSKLPQGYIQTGNFHRDGSASLKDRRWGGILR